MWGFGKLWSVFGNNVLVDTAMLAYVLSMVFQATTVGLSHHHGGCLAHKAKNNDQWALPLPTFES